MTDSFQRVPYQHSSLDYEAAIKACAAGNQEAVGRIYANERGQLGRAAQHIVRDHARAEDVIHDVFAQILRDAASFDSARGSARAWIYSILRHTALKTRYKTRREIPVDDEELCSMYDEHESISDPSNTIVENAALRSCLEALEPKRRASLILALIDGGTHAEVATHLGVPIGTVKAWLRRELIALRQQLK